MRNFIALLLVCSVITACNKKKKSQPQTNSTAPVLSTQSPSVNPVVTKDIADLDVDLEQLKKAGNEYLQAKAKFEQVKGTLVVGGSVSFETADDIDRYYGTLKEQIFKGNRLRLQREKLVSIKLNKNNQFQTPAGTMISGDRYLTHLEAQHSTMRLAKSLTMRAIEALKDDLNAAPKYITEAQFEEMKKMNGTLDSIYLQIFQIGKMIHHIHSTQDHTVEEITPILEAILQTKKEVSLAFKLIDQNRKKIIHFIASDADGSLVEITKEQKEDLQKELDLRSFEILKIARGLEYPLQKMQDAYDRANSF